MKYSSLYLAAASLLLGGVMASCSDDETVIENRVSVPVTELSVPVEGRLFSFDVESSKYPTVSASADWIKFNETVDLGNGVYTVSGEVDANRDNDGNTLEPRSTQISISAFNACRYITVSQEGKTDYELNYGNLGMVSSAQELLVKMGTGVNLGNTMESANASNGVVSGAGETAWGNPDINREYIAGIKKAGFSSVRIPCAWMAHSTVSGTEVTVDPAWMARVKEVVSYCIDNDLYVVLNDHYDIAWIETTMPEGYHSSKGEMMKSLWGQIAAEFNDFDEHLLFAGMNEPGCTSGHAHEFAALTQYEQDFIDAVRATGGNNATRTLIVQGPSTNIDLTCSGEYTLPTDNVSDRLMLEVHFYDPYQFTLMTEDANWGLVWYYYGEQNHVTGEESNRNNGTYGNEEWVAEQFKKLGDMYTSKGVPVIIGEYGAQNKTAALDQERQVASRAYWHEIVNRESARNGCAPFLWECGQSGHGDAFSMSDINRFTGEIYNPTVIEAILRGYAAGRAAN